MVTLGFAKMLKDEYDIFILKQLSNPISDEFEEVNVNITEYPNYIVDPEFFKLWVRSNKLDVVVFNEYDQWGDSNTNLPELAKEMGIKVYGYLVAERFEPSQVERYDRILVPTVTMERFMRANGCRKFTYIPFSIDLSEFPNPTSNPFNLKENDKFVYFHPGGFGGVHERKNTKAVIEAFIRLNDPNSRLIITAQRPINEKTLPKCEGEIIVINENLSRKDLLKYYYIADAVVLPSKWETIGIPIVEALACGRPVITTDAPPMNEFIRPNINGFICKSEMRPYPDITVLGADVNIIDLKNKMELIKNSMILEMFKKNSRNVVEALYDLEKNKKYFLDFLKGELNEKNT